MKPFNGLLRHQQEEFKRFIDQLIAFQPKEEKLWRVDESVRQSSLEKIAKHLSEIFVELKPKLENQELVDALDVILQECQKKKRFSRMDSFIQTRYSQSEQV